MAYQSSASIYEFGDKHDEQNGKFCKQHLNTICLAVLVEAF